MEVDAVTAWFLFLTLAFGLFHTALIWRTIKIIEKVEDRLRSCYFKKGDGP